MYKFTKAFWNGVKKMIPVNPQVISIYMKKNIPKEVKIFEMVSLSIAAIMLKKEKKPLCFIYKCAKCPLTNKSKKACLEKNLLLKRHEKLFLEMPVTWQHLKANEYGLKSTKPSKKAKKK